MSRYIDSEWLMNFFTDIPDNFTLTIGNLRATVNEAPSIDIVRCRECKWSKANGTYQWCGRLDSTARITADGFCSWGERSSE